VRNFIGDVIYHPKLFLAQDADLNPTSFLIGSANLSSSAFTTSVEVGVLGSDPATLTTLSDWFDDLFNHRAEAFTPENLVAMEARWRRAAAWRAKNRLLVRREIADLQGPVEPVTAEDVDAVEDVFSTIKLPIGLLNLDHGGNNIRNIGAARKVLENPGDATDKQRSEMKLLGLMQHGKLTEVGILAAAAQNEAEFALIWCRWLQDTSDAELREINPKLLVTKRVFPQFWSLKGEVRDYFLAHAQNPENRRLMQTIELLCNAKDIVQDFSLEDMQALSELLGNPASIPAIIRSEIMEYFDNKGTRSWSVADRRTIPMAWWNAANG